MSEEILHNEDKDTLRRRLEQLKEEYERTAQRLQRAEHHDATCRRVQNRFSDHNSFTQIDLSHTYETSIATSSVSTCSVDHQNLQLQTDVVAERNSSAFSAVQKNSAIEMQLAEIVSTPALYSPACRRSPAHRLRSKRSRLRLQNKERESDTDISQEKERDRSGDNIREKGSECTDKENSLKRVSNEGKKEVKDCEKKKEKKIEMMPVEEVNAPMIAWPVEKNILSGSAVSTQTSSFPQSSEAVHITDKSEGMSQQNNQSLTDSNKNSDRIDIKPSSFTSGILDSCTLVEGLPFPVEYYIRTTRRMAASNSSINLDAVIYSQLTGGRGRRRLSQSQMSGRGHMTPERSESVCKPRDQAKRIGKGQRGRRGRQRSTVGRPSCAKAALDCTISHPVNGSQADSESLMESKSDTESLSQSELVLKQQQVKSQSIQSTGSTVSLKPSPEQGVIQDLKHLPDSQLNFDSQLVVDSDLYQARSRGKGQRGRRGHRRSTVGRPPCAKAALDCTILHPASDSQADSECLVESKSNTESPSQSQLVRGSPQTEFWSIQSPGPAVSLKPSPEQGVTQDFKHLPDSQLYFDSQLVVDSDLYQARYRGKGQRGRRGHRRSTGGRPSCAKATLDCTMSHPASDSQADSESVMESKSDTESLSQSELVLKQQQVKSQSIQSTGSTVSLKPSPEQGVIQDLKHLPDSQLNFDSQLVVDSDLYQARSRGKGQRGRRGHRRSTVGRPPCAKAALDCTILHPASDSQADSECLVESKSNTESPSQSQLVRGSPQTEFWSIQSPGPAVSLKPSPEQGVTQDFKHLPDSQLYFDSQLVVDSDLYQARYRGKGQRGRRGHRRSTGGRPSCAKATLDCTMSHPASDSQADSESVMESKSDTESLSQSELVLKQQLVESQSIQSTGSTVSLKPSPEQGVTQDLKHLPDSQLNFDSQLVVDSDLYQSRSRGKGQRGRRGHRRSTVGRPSCAKAALDCTISHPASDSQADSECLVESKSNTDSPSQSQLVLGSPQTESWSIQSPGPAVSLKPSPEQGVTQDFKHLPDSQLCIDTQLLPDANLYPIFRRKHGQTGSEFQTNSNTDDQSPLLPSLASLIHALQEKEIKTGLLGAVDIQDFHLPDEDFGQLKLKILCLSTSGVQHFVQRPLVYNTRQSSRHQRVSGRRSNCEVHSVGELFTPDRLPTSSPVDSLPLCQSEPTDESQTEIQKDLNLVNEVKNISSDLVGSRQFSQTEPDKRISNETKVESSETENISELHINQMQKESHMLSENTSLCPEILNLSPSLTPQMQKGQDPLLPSLGMSPLIPGSPMDLLSPLFSSSGVLRSPSSVTLKRCVSPESVSAKTSAIIKNVIFTKSGDQGGSATHNQTQISQETMRKVKNTVKPGNPSQNNTALGYENLNGPEKESSCISRNELERKCRFDRESNPECGNKVSCTPENELYNIPEPGNFKNLLESEIQIQNNFEMEVQTYKCSELVSEIQSVNQFKSGNVGQTPVKTTSLDTSTNRRAETTAVSDNRPQSEERNTDAFNNRPLLHDETLTATSFSDAAGCSSVLQEMHTFKALEGGCVLDVCLVRWPSEDWCVCVAGEWSVCLWAQMNGVQPWTLLHTWTFAQPVMSLQVIPDSSGLLCVTLGHLEITEARVLCCPSMDGTFSQNVVCKDTLQAVVGVSNCRLVCCSTSGDQQRVNVLTVTQEGRVAVTLPLVCAKQNIRTLAVVEGEKDALIGWTECKTLLIWNIISGQLLQTIYLEKTLTMTNLLKGYSYRGVLCVLLQNAANVCDEDSNTSLFTLIATNPLTGKHITLTSINYPDQHKQQLIDGDVLGSGLAGVFQSGHLAVWDLRGSVAKVVGVPDELCRLARWAGPNTLLTGYLNGDVSVFHYKSA